MRRVFGGRCAAGGCGRRLALLAFRVLVQIAAVAGARPFVIEIEVPSGTLLAAQVIQFDPQELVRFVYVAALAERDRSADVLIEQNALVHQQLVRVDLRPARTVLVLHHSRSLIRRARRAGDSELRRTECSRLQRGSRSLKEKNPAGSKCFKR